MICHVTLLGGGFGRKSKPDYVAEAAVLSKKLGGPSRWSGRREDDIQFDYYHSVAAHVHEGCAGRRREAHRLAAALGVPSNWVDGRCQIDVMAPTANWVWALPKCRSTSPNLRVENGPAEAHVRIGWLRSVANIYHAFAIQSFANELAHAAGRDPLDYLLELIGPPRVLDLSARKYPNYGASVKDYPMDIGRLRQVAEIAAEKSGWGKRKWPKGRGMGIAVHRSFLTYVATVVEVRGQRRRESPHSPRRHGGGCRTDRQSRSRARSIRGRGGVRDQHRHERSDHGHQWRRRSIEL